ncbi:hypothetical protein P691DRAFT_773578 [Macrolepiota fuliginosa MF-IS2]|uniref:G domain-containing protein n=1 Tax=Macrolepiota fuliginosa MF-IS2 TaxID=1400762 RepID=A0A9P6C6J5_9AGAR|nr:hypothetical protein P691DRAFT_773578 [Macrolepiota fuliginosa MF-IS2]
MGTKAYPGSRKPLEPDQMSVASSCNEIVVSLVYVQKGRSIKRSSPFFRLTWPQARGKSQTNTGIVSVEKMQSFRERGRGADVNIKELTEEDTIIALMGLTGTGKTSFLSTAVGEDKGIGHSLESRTNEISAVRVQVPGEDFGLVLVDTPSFDDTYMSEHQTLELISDWLERA